MRYLIFPLIITVSLILFVLSDFFSEKTDSSPNVKKEHSKSKDDNKKGVTNKDLILNGKKINSLEKTENRSTTKNEIKHNETLIKKLLEVIKDQDEAEFAKLYEILRANNAKYAQIISQLSLDSNIPLGVRLSLIRLMQDMADIISLRALLNITEYDYSNAAIRAQAIKSLGLRDEIDAENRLRMIAMDNKDPGRAMAMSLLGNNKTQKTADLLVLTIESEMHGDHEVLNSAIYSLRKFRDTETAQTLAQIVRNESLPSKIRASALYSLGVRGDQSSLPIVKEHLNSQNRDLRYSAVLASVRISDSNLSENLINQIIDTSNFPHVRKAASESLKKHIGNFELAKFYSEVQKTDGYGIVLACDFFLVYHDDSTIPFLQEMSESTADSHVIQRIRKTIKKIEETK